MERRKGGKRRPVAAAAGAPRGLDRDAVISTAMEMFAGRGWSHTSLADIAAAAKVSLGDLHPVFPSKVAILRAFSTAIDRRVLGAPPESESSTREALFEIFMRRFDALQPQRKALKRLAQDLPRDPAAAMAVGLRGCRSIGAMAELAGVRTGGPLGALRVKALVALHAWVMRTWLDDESSDMARTMKALDQGLERFEMVARSLPGARRAAA